MSTHNICFCGEIRKKINNFLVEKMPYQELYALIQDDEIMKTAAC